MAKFEYEIAGWGSLMYFLTAELQWKKNALVFFSKKDPNVHSWKQMCIPREYRV